MHILYAYLGTCRYETDFPIRTNFSPPQLDARTMKSSASENQFMSLLHHRHKSYVSNFSSTLESHTTSKMSVWSCIERSGARGETMQLSCSAYSIMVQK
jgi:hypothetical protein